MLPLSPGYVHSSIKLMDMVSRNSHDLRGLAMALPKIELLPAKEVVDFATALHWVSANDEGTAVLTAEGERFRRAHSTAAKFRQCLLDYVARFSPPWAQLTPRGREETLKVLPAPLLQCFAEADLDKSYSGEVIAWWDLLAARARGLQSAALTETGRYGERLSLTYEEQRTGKPPRWRAVESNLSGYDILSVVSRHDSGRLQVEVKSSKAPIGVASFHVTRNEWEAALDGLHYLFHLWLLASEPHRLAVVSVDQMAEHIPNDRGNGRWESIEVRFKAFEDAFVKGVAS